MAAPGMSLGEWVGCRLGAGTPARGPHRREVQQQPIAFPQAVHGLAHHREPR